jgi:hypothetical protein
MIIIGLFQIFIDLSNDSKAYTVSYIEVLKKAESQGDYWMITKNPMDSKDIPIKIYIDNKNTWNLIEINKIYFASFEFDNKNNAKLLNIDYPDESK